MKTEVKFKWLQKMSFEADLDGHKLIIDANEENGGENQGPRPKILMLASLAGCTGMDVVSILTKMRVNYDSFSVHVEGETGEEHPKKYESMKIIYHITGKDIDLEKVQKAVNLSSEKYCGVSAFYNKVIDIEYEIKIN